MVLVTRTSYKTVKGAVTASYGFTPAHNAVDAGIPVGPREESGAFTGVHCGSRPATLLVLPGSQPSPLPSQCTLHPCSCSHF